MTAWDGGMDELDDDLTCCSKMMIQFIRSDFKDNQSYQLEKIKHGHHYKPPKTRIVSFSLVLLALLNSKQTK